VARNRSLYRAETPADRNDIAAVTTAAFGRVREARIVDAIRASDRFVPELSLVAEADGQVIGHVMLSYVDLGSTRVLELGPMSVHPRNQRNGVGGRLIREALRRADERGEPLVLVLGHPSYYPRFGFRPASEFGIEAPDPSLPDEVFMALPLKAFDPGLRGRVVLPPAFVEA
jgi:putative acetyltransferase